MAQARSDLVKCLRDAGADESLTDDVRLCVSELATNAVRHALRMRPEKAFVVVAYLTRRFGEPLLRVEVHDPEGRGRPDFPSQPLLMDQDALGGRGLPLVDMLAKNCGYTTSPHGKQVWAEFDPLGMHDDGGTRESNLPCAAVIDS